MHHYHHEMLGSQKIAFLIGLLLAALLALTGAPARAQTSSPGDFAAGTFHLYDVLVPQPREVVEALLPPGYELGEAPSRLTHGAQNHVLLVSLGHVDEAVLLDGTPLPPFFDVKLSIPHVRAPGVAGEVVYDVVYFYENPLLCLGVNAECQTSQVEMPYGDVGAFRVVREFEDALSTPVVEGSYQQSSESAPTALVNAVDQYLNHQFLLGSSRLGCNPDPTGPVPSCMRRFDDLSQPGMGPRTLRVDLTLKLGEFSCRPGNVVPATIELSNLVAIEAVVPFSAGSPQSCPAAP